MTSFIKHVAESNNKTQLIIFYLTLILSFIYTATWFFAPIFAQDAGGIYAAAIIALNFSTLGK